MLDRLIRSAAQLNQHQDEYRRLEYSLMLNLRLVNANFKKLDIYRINSSSILCQERFKNKTSIETMELVRPSNLKRIEKLTETPGMLKITNS